MLNFLSGCVMGVLAGLMVLPAQAADITAQEYEIKAAFLFNLGSFITWPQTTFNDPDEPFHICILGRDPFGEKLDAIVADQKISGHPVEIRRLNQVAQADDCEELFVSDSEQMRLQTVFKATRGKPILTVSDTQNFVANGGMIQFFPRDNKIRLMLDPQTFQEAGLKPGANLMRIAQLVRR
jgi:hypothetical protein